MRSKERLIELFDMVEEMSMADQAILCTGEEVLLIDGEVRKRNSSDRFNRLFDFDYHYGTGSGELCRESLYRLIKDGGVFGYCRYSVGFNYYKVIGSLNDHIEYDSSPKTILYDGKVYDGENYRELPRFNEDISLVEYIHPSGRIYYLLEKDVLEQVIEENETAIFEKKQELEVQRLAEKKEEERKRSEIEAERDLMLRIASGAAKFPKRA